MNREKREILFKLINLKKKLKREKLLKKKEIIK